MIDWIKPGNAGRKRVNYISIAISKAGHKAPAETHALCIRFSPQAVKDLRLIDGDRLLIGVDQVSKQICVKRTTNSDGYKLSSARSMGSTLAVSATVKMPWHEAVHIASDRVHQESAHFAFDVPEFFAGTSE